MGGTVLAAGGEVALSQTRSMDPIVVRKRSDFPSRRTYIASDWKKRMANCNGKAGCTATRETFEGMNKSGSTVLVVSSSDLNMFQ